MADIYDPKEITLLIAEQATFGTAIADDAAASWHLIQCKGGGISPDVQIIDAEADRGYRYKDVDDYYHTELGGMHKITIPDMVVRKNDMARFSQLFFHNCTEGASTPFSKVFTIPTAYPDFSADEGLFVSVIQKMPVASKSLKVNDAICQHLHLSTAPGKPLTLSADLVARGLVTKTANPSATVLEAAQSLFHWTPMHRGFLYNIGGSDITPHLYSIDIDLAWDVTLVGTDATSGGETYMLKNFQGKIEAVVNWDDDTSALFAALTAKTSIECEFGWGTGVTVGASDGDFLIAGHGLLDIGTAIERGQAGIAKKISMNLIGDATNTKVPITITIADADDKGY